MVVPTVPVDGGGTGPAAYRMATHLPSYFGTNANEPTFCHTASITLLGSEGNPVGDGVRSSTILTQVIHFI